MKQKEFQEKSLANQEKILKGLKVLFHLQAIPHLKKWLKKMKIGQQKILDKHWMLQKEKNNTLIIWWRFSDLAEDWKEKMHFHSTSKFNDMTLMEFAGVNMNHKDWESFLLELC